MLAASAAPAPSERGLGWLGGDGGLLFGNGGTGGNGGTALAHSEGTAGTAAVLSSSATAATGQRRRRSRQRLWRHWWGCRVAVRRQRTRRVEIVDLRPPPSLLPGDRRLAVAQPVSWV
ncbi:hypothetical protein BZL30_3013 [Mycobacterium kansasii]|uniref:Uncharacterized protein n=1 Tax=Mycobacterium kansasii TaxID=1768 RepID=A0A1V3XIC4_MYCKA|nr:hypothetical protein BZL30_3013 [Mycobacterium kansasii]